AEELADNELPAADRAGKHGVKGSLFDFFGHQADADENCDDDSEQRNRGEPEIDDDQLLDLNRNLAHENGRPREQKRESDQIVEHAVAYRFAEGIGGNVGDAGVHTVLFMLLKLLPSNFIQSTRPW